MKKENIFILKKKENTENITRGYILFNSKNDYTPFIVCSHYEELENGNITWDWGHYCETLDEALKVYYEEDMKHLNFEFENWVNMFLRNNLKNETNAVLDIAYDDLKDIPTKVFSYFK